MQSAQAAEQWPGRSGGKDEGQQRARSRALPKGLFTGWHRSLRLPAEQGAQPASQGNIKNLSLVMTSLKIFWHFPRAPVTFHLDFSCNFRLVRYWGRIILLNLRNPTTDTADMKIHALPVIHKLCSTPQPAAFQCWYKASKSVLNMHQSSCIKKKNKSVKC